LYCKTINSSSILTTTFLWHAVKYATPKPITGGREASEKQEGCTTVFVGNLSFHIDEDTLREAFSSCGEIASIRFAEDRETGAFKGFGHIEFVESESTDKAVAMAGEDVMGRPIRVDYANDRRGGEL
jgi:nucleolin